MILGRPILHWLVTLLIAVLVFFLAQWLIPLLAGVVGLAVPSNIVNILALLIAIGVVYGGYNYRSTPAA